MAALAVTLGAVTERGVVLSCHICLAVVSGGAVWRRNRGEWWSWRMENTSRALKKQSKRSIGGGSRFSGGRKQYESEKEEGEEGGGEECDQEAWETLSKSFRDVQTVLDQNRNLIQQVNENHQSKLPDNISRNVDLIREINGNISKVVGMYSDLSVNFSGIVHQRRSGGREE
nr:protein EARLY FLOWERING 4-like [Ipomoea batatas]